MWALGHSEYDAKLLLLIGWNSSFFSLHTFFFTLIWRFIPVELYNIQTTVWLMFHYNSCHHYSGQVKTDEDVCGGENELVFAPPGETVKVWWSPSAFCLVLNCSSSSMSLFSSTPIQDISQVCASLDVCSQTPVVPCELHVTCTEKLLNVLTGRSCFMSSVWSVQ